MRDLTLVESLMGLIEEAESREEDPDQLEFLYKIDHLVTRMRRNGENLLVLAGQDSGDSQPQPVPLVDVLRAAISEIGDYGRVRIDAVPNLHIGGLVADDVSHLLAELLDNATSKSPQYTEVVVSARAVNGPVMILVEDQGIGIPAERLAELNARFAGSPTLDVSVTRHMGLYVVSRLAHRHGLTVQLHARPGGGTVAALTVPPTLLQRVQEALTGIPENRPRVTVPTELPRTGPVPSAAAASLMSGDGLGMPRRMSTPGPPAPPAQPARPPMAPPAPAPATAGTTGSGLPRRTPVADTWEAPPAPTPNGAAANGQAHEVPANGVPASEHAAPGSRSGSYETRTFHDDLGAFEAGQRAALEDTLGFSLPRRSGSAAGEGVGGP
jgi:two-component sensor histidine kinase